MSFISSAKTEWDRILYCLGMIGFGVFASSAGAGLRDLGMPLYFALPLDAGLVIAGTLLLIAVFKKDYDLRSAGIIFAVANLMFIAGYLLVIAQPLFVLFFSLAMLHIVVLRQLRKEQKIEEEIIKSALSAPPRHAKRIMDH